MNGLYPIYLYANINGKVKYFTLNQFVSKNAWNEKKQEVKLNWPGWKYINDDISRYRTRAERLRIEADEANLKLSSYEFEQTFRYGLKDLSNVFTFIDQDLIEFKSTYRPDTVLMYLSQAKKLRQFSPDLQFSDLNFLFWKRYEGFLISIGNNGNTRWKAFRFIKTYINKAISRGVIKSDPLPNIKVRKPEGNRIALTIDELKTLETIFPTLERDDLKCVLRYFLFACFTGMRFRDIVDLNTKNISSTNDETYIQFVQHKTSESLVIPLGLKALNYLPAISEKQKKLFDTYSNQATNRLLKEVMNLAGIEKSISFHCARHTCATLLHELSGDIYTTSKILGQRKIDTTLIYTKVRESSKRKLVELMDKI